jgi:hypothetical protein
MDGEKYCRLHEDLEASRCKTNLKCGIELGVIVYRRGGIQEATLVYLVYCRSREVVAAFKHWPHAKCSVKEYCRQLSLV